MCGFVGILGERNPELLPELLATLEHRGPDGEGTWYEPRLSLGHRRLAIIDVARGQQPMATEDGRFVIAYNGEIYNHAELRAELEARGHRFRTRVDTEVVLRGVAEQGADFLPRLRGMFAFALWDAREARCLLARDPMGVKPLYYGRFDGRLHFASEIKAIVADPRVPRRCDLQALDAFLTFLEYPAELTAFEGIRQLPAGHCAWVRTGEEPAPRAYYETPFPERYPERVDEEACVEGVLERARETVGLRLMSDVPLGCFLSGGVDSSLVAALMAEASDRPIRTFSLVHRRQAPWLDESEHIHRMVDFLGAEHTEIESDPAWYRRVPELITSFDQPCTTALNSYMVSRLAAGSVKVALTGTGGDEGFAGYQPYEVAGAWRRQAPLARRLASTARTLVRAHGAPAVLRDAGSAFYAWKLVFDDAARRRCYGPTLRAAVDPEASRGLFERFFRRPDLPDDLARCLYADQKLYLIDNLHNNLDKVSMAHGLEGRVPLADFRFLEYANAIPSELKLRGGELKYLLKKAAARVVPPEVIYRPKRGFSIPLRTWMDGPFRDALGQVLRREAVDKRGLFSGEAVDALLRNPRARSYDASLRLWILFAVELWHRLYIDSRAFLSPPSFEDLAA